MFKQASSQLHFAGYVTMLSVTHSMQQQMVELQ
jgi:hypothetical protein